MHVLSIFVTLFYPELLKAMRKFELPSITAYAT